MAVKDPTKIQVAVPGNRMDQIVDIVTGSFTVGPATGSGFIGNYTSTQGFDSKPAIANDYFYTLGIWSNDNGATWQDMGAELAVGTDSVVGTLTLTASCDSTGQHDSTPGLIYVDVDNGGFSSQTILYKVLVMARFDQATPIPTKALSQVLRYSSANNYMKIDVENKVVLPGSGVTSIPLPPELVGKQPNIMGWILSDDTAYGGTDSGMFPLANALSVDDNNLYCRSHSFAGVVDYTLYYRIYLDD